jgi:hypothetical protein
LLINTIWPVAKPLEVQAINEEEELEITGTAGWYFPADIRLVCN